MPHISSSSLFDALIWFGVAYVFAYYALARSVLAKINRLDPDYFDLGTENGELPVGIKTSWTIFQMIIDSDLPGRDYGDFVRTGLYVARGMFVCYFPLLGYVLYLAAQPWQ
jgi:hypothetical protein